jgi:t-SNARE complex subunit (syntaxin)
MPTGEQEESIQRSQLYSLLLRVASKVDVVETKLVGIEKRLEQRVDDIEEHIDNQRRWRFLVEIGIIVILIIAGMTVVSLIWSGRI